MICIFFLWIDFPAWIKFLLTAYWPTGESACQKAIWQDAVKCDCTCLSFFNFNVIWRLSFRIVENSFALFILSDSQSVLISTSFDVGAYLLFNCTFSKQIHVQLFNYLCFDVLKVELFFSSSVKGNLDSKTRYACFCRCQFIPSGFLWNK